MRYYKAPWSVFLKFVTITTSMIVLVVGGVLGSLAEDGAMVMLAIFVPVLAIASGAAFMVRGYEIQEQRLIVHRPGWTTTFPLHDLTQVRYDPNAVRRSLRLFGNGGFFAFVGWFRNKSLGVYRFFGTDPERCVVLRFRTQKTIVVTPDKPEEFVRELHAKIQPL